jgi:2-hydroxy-3-keto-5-methylthiopentenyl-1-phosphate phosphatase
MFRTPERNVPEARRCQVWLDFDGTTVRQDVLDEMIRRHSVDDSWLQVEERWQAGLIGSRQCLQEQFALLRMSPRQLDDMLDAIEIDEGMFSLVELLEEAGVPLVILSDGVDSFIGRILCRHGLSQVEVRANSVVREGLAFRLLCPHGHSWCECEAAHCKCASMALMGDRHRRSVYIGDGRSDLCPARKADCVFAKSVLAECLARESAGFIPYSTLHDVVAVLSNAWKGQLARQQHVGGLDARRMNA